MHVLNDRVGIVFLVKISKLKSDSVIADFNFCVCMLKRFGFLILLILDTKKEHQYCSLGLGSMSERPINLFRVLLSFVMLSSFSEVI